MNFLESFNNKTILIPLLQRDYVQGGSEDVISPFLDALLDKECDLTYIYGYEEDGCFVPVDGQQRLLTLWLLHLYLFAYKKSIKDFDVKMKFASRQFAEDFCSCLHGNLESLLAADSKVPIDKLIIDQGWFFNSWLSNASVRNMLNTLKFLQHKITSDNIDRIWDKLINTETPNISFAFLWMKEDDGLDDDIYIKMNGRGRKLSPFENLKSFMDEHVSKLPFSDSWKEFMDNDWTDLFWKNRNLTQEHPEEIDDEQLFFFYNMLILYHVRRGDVLNTVRKMKTEDVHLYEELLNFLEENEGAEENEVVSRIIKRLQKAGKFPLIWFERLQLLTDDFYEDVFCKLCSLTKRSRELNDMSLFIGAGYSDSTSKTYQLGMCEGSFERTLPLLYAAVSYKEGITSFFDWMRTLRNLILNTDISEDDISAVLNAIDRLGDKCREQDIYAVLRSDDISEVLEGFNKRQIGEEVLKASHPELYDDMIVLENGRFFRGCIGILFRLLSEGDSHDVLSVENVKYYSSVLLAVFDGSDGGLNYAFDDERHLLRRALMTFKPYFFGQWRKWGWSFCDGIDEWRGYLKSDYNVSSLQQLMKDILVPAYKDGRDLETALYDYVESVSRNYEKDICEDDNASFRFHFIHHPGVWDYMQTKICSWDSENDFNIVLKSCNGSNSNHMELRTYGLYLDYKFNDVFQDVRDLWYVDIWPRELSCMYFQRDIVYKGSSHYIAIDLYFLDNNNERANENCYCFDLFVRTNHPYPENEEESRTFADEDYNLNLEIFAHLKDDLSLFIKKDDGRLHSKRTYSRSGVIETLRGIMDKIASFDYSEL